MGLLRNIALAGAGLAMLACASGCGDKTPSRGDNVHKAYWNASHNTAMPKESRQNSVWKTPAYWYSVSVDNQNFDVGLYESWCFEYSTANTQVAVVDGIKYGAQRSMEGNVTFNPIVEVYQNGSQVFDQDVIKIADNLSNRVLGAVLEHQGNGFWKAAQNVRKDLSGKLATQPTKIEAE